MGSSAVLLLSVLYALEVTVHSQTYPYISFMGVTLRNNSYADINLLEDSYTNSVQCHTDLSTCCTVAEGRDRADWFFPSGLALGFVNSDWGNVYTQRAAQRADMRRRGNKPIKANGMYRCSIGTTAASGRVSVYVGLYDSGGENVEITLYS